MKYQEHFIKRSNEIHQNKYDYSLVEYVDTNTKVKIICSEHGIFEKTPKRHYKEGCPKCSNNNRKYTTKEFVDKSNSIHKYKYDYSITEYIGIFDKVKIICPIHGMFEQKPNDHLNKKGCPYCGGTIKYTKERLIERFNEIHNNKYKYYDFIYNDYYQTIKINCPIHGDFEQKISTHLSGCGCSICGLKIKTTEQFIKDSILKHGDYYDYSLVEYKKHNEKVKIICPKHGIFEQTAKNHTDGYGCEKCSESKGEKEIRKILENVNIKHIQQKTFNDCKDKQVLQFDFYLPDYNVCIEYDGEPHFKVVENWGGEYGLKDRQKKDKIKTDYCKENNINLLRIRFDENIQYKMKVLIDSF